MAKTILVVDDDVDMVEVLCTLLGEAGYATETAHSGTAALEKARAKLPDLVLLDLRLPEMDGYAVCEALRAQEGMASVPVIMLTGLPGELPRLAGVEAGANDYLNKPFAPEQLLERVRKALRRPPKARAGKPTPRPLLRASHSDA